MNFITTLGGNYPRIGDEKKLQKLRRTIDQWEKGKKTEQDLARAQDEMTRCAIDEQIEAGIDLVTDGQIRWTDPVSHLLRNARNVAIKGLLRFYDTNFYFRQPEISGPVGGNGAVTREEFAFARAHSTRPVKPVLTGPHSLASLSLRKGVSLPDAVKSLAALVAAEVEALAAAGANLIQLDEPEILRRPGDFPLLAEALAIVCRKKGPAKILLMSYFGDATPHLGRFQELPVDVLGFDFTYAPGLPAALASSGFPKPLCLGVVDGRNTKMEKATEVARVVAAALKKSSADSAYLSTSCGLEYLPRNRAFDKLELLADVKAALQKST